MANCIRCGRKLPPMSFKKICQWCVHHEAVQRGEDSNAPQPVMAAPWVRRGESSISLTQMFFGASVAVFIAMVLASGPSLDFTGQVMVHFGANYGPYTLSGQWWRPAHRLQHVVSVGPGRACRVALWPLDFRRDLPHHRDCRRLGECGVESRS